MSEISKNALTDFKSLSLHSELLAVLERLDYVTPTPIQEQAIPIAISGRDVIGIAQTGTGKTLAFGLPIMERLRNTGGVALIVAPTRELAIQIDEVFQKVGRPLGFRTAVLIGGAPMGRQVSQLRNRPHAIIATPGRLKDHMMQRTVSLKPVTTVVLDEADRMLDMGFAPIIREILKEVPTERQTMLFSATMPDDIIDIARSYMRDPIRVEVAAPGKAADLVSQELYVVKHESKGDLLKTLLSENNGTVLVFARTRHGARKVARQVHHMGHSSAELHSDRTLAQRRAALDGFKRGDYRVLVATDIAARGIDVKQISLVINYDLPDNPDDYVHRIGRTGRAGEVGRAITLATPEQMRDVQDIERLIKTEIPLSQHSELPMERFTRPDRSHFGKRPQNGNRHNGRPIASANRPNVPNSGMRRGPKAAKVAHH